MTNHEQPGSFTGRWIAIAATLITAHLVLIALLAQRDPAWSSMQPNPSGILLLRELVAIGVVSAALATIRRTSVVILPVLALAAVASSGWMTYTLVGAFPNLAAAAVGERFRGPGWTAQAAGRMRRGDSDTAAEPRSKPRTYAPPCNSR